MSVFRQLMMQPKITVHYINLTKVGNPTIVDGVASGFSSGNFIKFTNSVDLSKPFEFLLKIKTGALKTSPNKDILGVNSTGVICIGSINQNGKIAMLLSTNTSSWNISTSSGPTVLSDNTVYWIKFSWTGSQYIIQISTDGINYSTEITVNSTDMINNTGIVNLQFGYGNSANGWVFNGEIDFNYSKVILDGVEYLFNIS